MNGTVKVFYEKYFITNNFTLIKEKHKKCFQLKKNLINFYLKLILHNRNIL